jgi:type II secretion system protein C
MVASLLFALTLAQAQAPPDVAVSGVVVRRTPERSTAILTAGGRARVVAVGDTAFGGRVTAIDAATVTLDFGGAPVVLRLPTSAPPARAAAPSSSAARSAALPAAAPPEDPATPAKAMERVEVQRRLGDEIPRILAETTIAPVMEDGRVTGVQVARLPEGSLLTDAGLRAGDVITEVNGTQIDGMATLVGLWPRLQSASELRAVVVRNGQPVSLVVALR